MFVHLPQASRSIGRGFSPLSVPSYVRWGVGLSLSSSVSQGLLIYTSINWFSSTVSPRQSVGFPLPSSASEEGRSNILIYHRGQGMRGESITITITGLPFTLQRKIASYCLDYLLLFLVLNNFQIFKLILYQSCHFPSSSLCHIGVMTMTLLY